MLFTLKIGELALPFEIADDRFSRKLVEKCPIWCGVKKWKQELIVELPQDVEIDVRDVQKSTVKFTTCGDVLYWPEGNAICFFYGISQPYCPAPKIGTILAIPERLGQVQAEEVTVDRYDMSTEQEFQDVLRTLRNLGYKCATATLEEGDGIVCLKQIDEYRLYIELYVEKDLVHIYTRPLFKYDFTPSIIPYISFMRELAKRTRFVRVDLDYYDNVCLSAIPSRDGKDIIEAIQELEKTYMRVLDRLQVLT